jgi:hypothetical protein
LGDKLSGVFVRFRAPRFIGDINYFLNSLALESMRESREKDITKPAA